MQLSDSEQAMLNGDYGEAVAMSTRLVVALAEAVQAEHLLEISGAHIDGCLYHGQASLDFAERLAALGAKVKVPTTLNVASLDRIHPEIMRLGVQDSSNGSALMDAYEAMGATPTWTCAPYQLQQRPEFGQHIAWAESNAIVFANSVLGARSDRYGDFIDVAAAVCGRVPAAGLHLDTHRAAKVVYDVSSIPARYWEHDATFPVLGYLVGSSSAELVPAIVGMNSATEDDLKALGAAAASSGSVGLFHIVGITPEAPTLSAATAGEGPVRTEVVDLEDLKRAYRSLTLQTADRTLGVVNLGTPHYSSAQLLEVLTRLDGRSVHPEVDLYVNTGRDALAASGVANQLAASGVKVITDTCTYVTSIIAQPESKLALTDSAKWAHYAPGNLAIDVIFASMDDCIESAVAGKPTLSSARLWAF